jgi:hypothetical protein
MGKLKKICGTVLLWIVAGVFVAFVAFPLLWGKIIKVAPMVIAFAIGGGIWGLIAWLRSDSKKSLSQHVSETFDGKGEEIFKPHKRPKQDKGPAGKK